LIDWLHLQAILREHVMVTLCSLGLGWVSYESI
jgi:hypothetical protein